MENSPYLGILIALFFIFYPLLRKVFESAKNKGDPVKQEGVRKEKLQKFKKFLGSIQEDEAPPKPKTPKKNPPKPLLANRKKLYSTLEETKQSNSIEQRQLTSAIEGRILSPGVQEAFVARWGETEVVSVFKEKHLTQVLRRLSQKQTMVLYHEILKGPKSRCTKI